MLAFGLVGLNRKAIASCFREFFTASPVLPDPAKIHHPSHLANRAAGLIWMSLGGIGQRVRAETARLLSTLSIPPTGRSKPKLDEGKMQCDNALIARKAFRTMRLAVGIVPHG
jgi:hypothetical protein